MFMLSKNAITEKSHTKAQRQKEARKIDFCLCVSVSSVRGIWGKFLFLFLLIFLVTGFSWAQQPWWLSLEQGKLYFRSGAYGDALMAFEDARRGRETQFTRMEQDFILLLSSPDARRLGDSLEFIEMLIADRHETAAAAALAELYYRVPKDSLRGSATTALKEFDRLKSYPEAEFWLGETYRAEGELAIALKQYEKALSQKALLETPGFDMEILYKITEIHRLRGNYQEMERRAREILEGTGPAGRTRDELWAGPGANQIRSAMSRVLENEGINRFLTLYRHNNTDTERAHRLLGFFYYASSRFSPAVENLMFAFLIQNTILIQEIIKHDMDFSFTSLENLLVYAGTRPELVLFLEETEYYRTAYYLASALYATGKSRPSRELWAFLAGSANAGEWGERARRNPSPYLERPVEMP